MGSPAFLLVSRPALRRRCTILLVDDSGPFVAAARELLQQIAPVGKVEVAHSAEEAIVFAAHYRPALVLLDYEMPGANGLAALRAIKSRAPAPRVIMMTLHDSPSLVREARAAGVDAFLSKGELFDRLPQVVQQLLDDPDAQSIRGS